MRHSKSLNRIYFSGQFAPAAECTLPAAQSHHVRDVLRLRDGDPVTLFDGSGAEYPSRIVRIGKREITVLVAQRLEVDRESPLAITLVQAVSAGERMDYTVQKAVELGVVAIQPVTSARTILRLDAERAAKRVAHWQAVAISACEQCGRNRVPIVLPVLPFGRWVAQAPLRACALGLLLAPDAPRTVRELARPQGAVALLAGPEGGYAPKEERAALTAGFLAVRLGPRVLRTETAALVGLAALQALWGDL
jgi:16S rRNA (uracil1498-N3)-methyltransferase